MPLYVCRFCDYNTKQKKGYYYHLYKHINEHNASFDKEELELCKFYHNKKTQIDKTYSQNNKDKILQRKKEYRQNNKDIISQRDKEYYLRKKLEKEEANILDVYDSD